MYFLLIFLMLTLLILAVILNNPLFTVVSIILLIFSGLFLAGKFLHALARRMRRQMADAVKSSSLPHAVNNSLKRSRYYGNLIIQTAQEYPPGPMRDRLNRTLQSVDQWLANLDRLEQGLIKLYSQRNLARELRQTNSEIERLRRQLLASSGQEAAYLGELKKSKEQHLLALQELHQFQLQAELKIHKIASDLGSAHAEMLLLIAKGDFNENRFQRLDENLQEHLSSMRDMMAAMDDLGYSSAAG